MMYPLVRDLAARDRETRIPVAVTCRVLGFKPQAYYKWLAKPRSDPDLENAYLTNTALEVHADDPEFGYRFVCDELVAAGHACGENRVQRLCSRQGVFSTHSRKSASLDTHYEEYSDSPMEPVLAKDGGFPWDEVLEAPAP